jgi:hypothetical protein
VETLVEGEQLGESKNIINIQYIVAVSYSEIADGSLLLFNGYCILYGVKAAWA